MVTIFILMGFTVAAAQDTTRVVEDSTAYLFVDPYMLPEFSGGDFSRYVKENITIPGEKGIKRTVWVEFVITAEGKVDQAKVVKGVAGRPDIEQEALRIVNSSPLWKPGQLDGKNMSTRMTVPVKFGE